MPEVVTLKIRFHVVSPDGIIVRTLHHFSDAKGFASHLSREGIWEGTEYRFAPYTIHSEFYSPRNWS